LIVYRFYFAYMFSAENKEDDDMIQLLLVIIYLAFISLGLPDSLLGSAWPTMYGELGVPVSYAGVISMIICIGTIISSLQSDRLTKRLGAGKVTAISVGTTAVALFGFSISHSFLALCLWAIPYGFGAGSVDAALNNYVALHYASRHMSWLHCMWGVGTTIGPYIMGVALTGGYSWNVGYRCISVMQVALTFVLVMSLPLWNRKEAADAKESKEQALSSGKGIPSGKENGDAKKNSAKEEPLSLSQIVRIQGAKEVMFTFFCYCALESTAGLWASSYLVLQCGLSTEKAAGLASMFYIGITVGRGINGFLTFGLSDTSLIRLGQGIIALGMLAVLVPGGTTLTLIGLVLIGLGCAPIYPCIIHSTPVHFGADKSQAIIGVQMASAYVGSCLMPPLFGLIANHISVRLFPVYLLVILVVMMLMHERLIRKTQ